MSLGRRAWASLGLVFVGLGFVGAVVPGMPTTVFLILALYCFKKGSARFEQWLLNHPVFGLTLRDWEKYKGMRQKSKKTALVTMWVFLGASCIVLARKPQVMAIVLACGAFATWYILSRPNIPEELTDGTAVEPETEASIAAA